jgi:cysteine desulfurase
MFNFFKKQNRNIYLDYAAATPVREEVIKEMQKAFAFFANPGSIHKDGLLAKKKLAEMREEVARSLRSRADEIVFTATGTESDNLAIRGAVMAFIEKNGDKKPHIITSKVEHAGVLEVCKALEKEGLA